MTVSLQSAMESLDLTPRELASEAGLSRSIVRDAMDGKGVSERTRLLIEATLGRPVWASQEQFQQDQERRRIFGKEPAGIEIRDLHQMARRLGVRYGKENLRSRGALIARLEKALRMRGDTKPRVPSEKAARLARALADCREVICLDCETVRAVENKSPRKCLACGGTRLVPNVPELLERFSAIHSRGENIKNENL